jgi:hypothetical protein
MGQADERRAWVYGVIGLLIGLVIGNVLHLPLLLGFRGPIGVPELFVLAGPLLFVAFWVVLIGAIVRGLGLLGRDRTRRLEDLPADFDDWHRRAHAQMMREAAAADDSGRRG